MSLRNELEKWSRSLKRKLSNIIVKGMLESLKKSDDGINILKVITGEGINQTGIPFVQNYGNFCIPKKDSKVVLLNLGGNPSNAVAIVVDDRTGMPAASEGDTGLFNSDETFIHLKGKEVFITCPSGGQVNINDGNLTIDV